MSLSVFCAKGFHDASPSSFSISPDSYFGSPTTSTSPTAPPHTALSSHMLIILCKASNLFHSVVTLPSSISPSSPVMLRDMSMIFEKGTKVRDGAWRSFVSGLSVCISLSCIPFDDEYWAVPCIHEELITFVLKAQLHGSVWSYFWWFIWDEFDIQSEGICEGQLHLLLPAQCKTVEKGSEKQWNCSKNSQCHSSIVLQLLDWLLDHRRRRRNGIVSWNTMEIIWSSLFQLF